MRISDWSSVVGSSDLGLPMRDAKAMILLFRERLDSLNDPLDPGFGFDLVRLCVPRTEPLAPAQLNLEGGSVSEMEVAALIDRLSTRLGRSRLKRFQSRDTHIPEQAQLALPATEAGTKEPSQWVISRAEEHTSELQSLMSISYAVFCLKKKKHIK